MSSTETKFASVLELFLWETTSRRQDRVKLSPLDKCPIKATDMFAITVVTLIMVMKVLMYVIMEIIPMYYKFYLQSLGPWSFTIVFQGRSRGTYIQPNLKIKISSIYVRNSTQQIFRSMEFYHHILRKKQVLTFCHKLRIWLLSTYVRNSTSFTVVQLCSTL